LRNFQEIITRSMKRQKLSCKLPLRREQTPVTVLLTDGSRLAGRVKSFDRFSILLESQGQEQLLFKHAIASIAPSPTKAT